MANERSLDFDWIGHSGNRKVNYRHVCVNAVNVEKVYAHKG